MSETRSPGSQSPVRAFFGAALIAVGALIMLLCGGCGALFFVAFLVDTFDHPNDAAMLLMPLALGGLPAAVGFGLFVWGRALRRAPAAGIERAGGDAP